MGRYVSIIADVHGNAEAMYEVYRHITDARSNRYLGYGGPYLGNIFAGDLIDYGVNPNECTEYLTKHLKPLVSNNGKVVGTLGNHDVAILDKDYSRFRTEHGKKSAMWTAEHIDKATIDYLNTDFDSRFEDILVCHGNDIDKWKNIFPNSYSDMDEMIERNPDIKVFIIAHSHLQFECRYRDRLFINPGSVGQSRNGVPSAHYALLDLDTKRVSLKKFDYDIKATADKIHSEGLDIFLSQRLYLGI